MSEFWPHMKNYIGKKIISKTFLASNRVLKNEGNPWKKDVLIENDACNSIELV